jgi:peptidyl-prolyl cis-trans isomerase D
MKGSSLDAIAKGNNVSVQNALLVSIDNPSIPNVGFEPSVVGTAISLEKNKLSSTIVGNTAVYVIKTAEVQKALPTEDYTAQLTGLKSQSSNAVNRIFVALKDQAKIKDNRIDFNY